MKVLAIETSCDDTSLAIVEHREDGVFCVVMRSVSQIDIHRQYGGVVPELASRSHLHDIMIVYHDLMVSAGYDDVMMLMDDIDCIAVTVTPWLPGSLIVGRTFWQMLSCRYSKPYIPINHLHGHVLSFLLDKTSVSFGQCLVLSISGWHSDLSLLISHGGIKHHVDRLWSTQDDAIGEVFDKVSRLLWWPYPGGVWIWQQAARYDETIEDYGYIFKRTVLDGCQYSFSWFKSQAHQFITHYRQTHQTETLSESFIIYLAYQFQEAVLDSLLAKMREIYDVYQTDAIAIVGWVSANFRLREKISTWIDLKSEQQWVMSSIYFPEQFLYCTDNAAMIGVVAGVELI